MASYNARDACSERGRQCIGGACSSAHAARPSPAAGGWLPFDRFMALALYEPGLGYYASGSRQFGAHARRRAATSSPRPSCRRCSAGRWRARWRRRWRPAARDEVWEFGAGSGALAAQLLRRAGRRVCGATPSSTSRARCAQRQARAPGSACGDRVQLARRAARRDATAWCVGNEVLDAMPVQLLHFDGAALVRARRGLRSRRGASPGPTAPTALRPPVDGAVRARHGDRDPPAGRGLRRARWPSACSAARPSSSTTASPRPSTTTRSAPAAR